LVIKSGKFVSNYITPVDIKDIQPNGVDLHIHQIKWIQADSWPILTGEERVHAKMTPIGYTNNGLYELTKGNAYLVTYREIIKIPEECVGLLIVRSSLQRNGVWLSTALWDSGYEGRGTGTLFCFSNIKIHKDFAVGQLILIDAEKPEKTYDGQYQHEGLAKGRI